MPGWVRSLAYRLSRRRRRLEMLRAAWGKGRVEPRSIHLAAMLHERRGDPDHGRYFVDRRTWQDLDMDLVFSAVDHTMTPLGSQFLYRRLRVPVQSAAELAETESLVRVLGEDAELRERVQQALEPLDQPDGWFLPALLWDELPAPRARPILFQLLSVGLPCFVILALGLSPIFWIAAAANLVANVFIHGRMERAIGRYLGPLRILAALPRAVRSLRALGASELCKRLDPLEPASRAAARLGRRVRVLQLVDPFEIVDYLQAVLLTKVNAYLSVRRQILAARGQLAALHATVGEVDFALGVASLRASRQDWCVPRFGGGRLLLRDARHPAVPGAVGNDLTLEDRGALISGSNTSGKTTFIKTVAVNTILARSLHTVFAADYEGPLLDVLSSIDVVDSLVEGKSYYLTEVESAKRLVDRAAREEADGDGTERRALLAVDEIFRGTNPAERVAAAVEVLRYLASRQFVIASTHDVEICRRLAGEFDNYHFQEQASEEGLAFDYRLRPGVSRAGNAIALLELLGFPPEIVAAARGALAQQPGRS